MRGVPSTLPRGVTIERDGPLTRTVGERRGFVTGPQDLGVRGAELDRLIERQQAFYAARGEAVEWKTRAHDEPRDIVARLVAAGFEAEPPETVVVARADALSVEAALPDGVVLRETSSERDMRRIGAFESVVWGADMAWIGDDLIGRIAAAPDQIAVLVAEAGDTVVAAAWLVFRPGTRFAGLLGGSTLAAWRGRGIYRALVAARAARARARGVRYLQVDASAESAPILQRLGFTAVTETRPYVWAPPA